MKSSGTSRLSDIIAKTLCWSTLFSAAGFTIAGLLGTPSLWGINHIYFLSPSYVILYLLAFVAMIIVSILPDSLPQVESSINRIDNWLWGERRAPRLALVACCLLLFIIFHARVQLLGDSYTWLSVFSRGESYIHKWTEPVSFLLVRQLQSIMGAYTFQTALQAFQILSYISGVIYFYCVILIIGQVTDNATTRLLGLTSLIFSGTVLLFFGYAEFYSMVWAPVALFIYLSLRWLKTGRGLWAAIIVYFVALIMHLQALYFLPGVAYLLLRAVENTKARILARVVIAASLIGGIILFLWLYGSRIDFEILILPLFHGRPPADDYFIFSLPHLLNIINLVFLIFPGALTLAVIWFFYGKKSLRSPVAAFLASLSAGGLAFLLLFGAGTTMARDWDIMSLSLLAPMLLIIYQIDQKGSFRSFKTVISYALLAALMTFAFVAVNRQSPVAEERFRTLLDSRNENGWMILADHYLQKGDTTSYIQVVKERNRIFPNLARLQLAYAYLEKGEYARAGKLARELYAANPYNADFLQIMGNLYGKEGQNDSAREFYHRALAIRPFNTSLMNELGQLYIKEAKYDSALIFLERAHRYTPTLTHITESIALAHFYKQDYKTASAFADTLFAADKNSPGGHLVKMVIALKFGDRNQAAQHYRQYLIYGRERSDYPKISAYYKNLAQ